LFLGNLFSLFQLVSQLICQLMTTLSINVLIY
jgi:hypothetical protein